MRWFNWNKKSKPVDDRKESAISDHVLDRLWMLQKDTEAQWIFEARELAPWYGLSPIQEAFTIENFSLWHNGCQDPIVTKVKRYAVPRAKVKGCLFLILPSELVLLDKDREVGVKYDRKNVPVLLPQLDNRGIPYTWRTWMYVGKQEYWDDKIEWDQTFHRSNPSYKLAKVVKDNRPWLNVYYEYDSKNDFIPRSFKCYLGITNGGSTDAKQQDNRAA